MSGHREFLWPIMLDMSGDSIDLEVQRNRIEHGLTFSADAMEKLYDEIVVWVGTRIARRWDETNEPPTLLRVELRVTTA